jgi:hypothetical protein
LAIGHAGRALAASAVILADAFGMIWVFRSSSTQAVDGAKPLVALSLPQTAEENACAF